MQTRQLDSLLLAFLQKESIMPASMLEAYQAKYNGDECAFERSIIQEGFMTDAQLGQVRAQLNGWHAVDLRKQALPEGIEKLLSKAFAETRRAIVFSVNDKLVKVATSNPDDQTMIRLLEKKFSREVQLYFVTDSVIQEILNVHYNQETQRKLQQLSEGGRTAESDDAVVDLVNTLLLHAARSKASDIHIEPNVHDVVVRERVDGFLRKVSSFSKDTHEQIVQRIKVLSSLATDEHMQPQDGKFTVENLDGKRADVRVSIIPMTNGEDIVLRLLVSESQVMPLESLGMDEAQRKIMEEEMAKAWGMILVTGPTGSGKTTTLYATVLKLHSEELSIASIEDPVEYDLPGTNQIQVHEKIGVTFAAGLRSLVRHDPNVILVGEIRDSETASIAVNAALTGHLVLSTLHTNDSATAILRLRDMDLEPFLLSSTINLIIAQRLVRTICTGCKESYEISEKELAKMLPADAIKTLLHNKKSVRLYEGKGCSSCGGKGFRGRTAILEFLQVNDEIRARVMEHADADTIRKAAIKAGMKTIMEDGLKKALEGQTTIQEVFRVIRL